ncbi:Uncharacterised protein [Mycobacteroides abscessus subsp. abscessus]|nr:Uncharacterised protein [Mycobacteroides abscessus subsp. abscessus]
MQWCRIPRAVLAEVRLYSVETTSRAKTVNSTFILTTTARHFSILRASRVEFRVTTAGTAIT